MDVRSSQLTDSSVPQTNSIPAARRRLPGLGKPRHLVVVGQGEDVDAAARGAGHDGGGGEEAVRAGRVAVEVVTAHRRRKKRVWDALTY